MVAQNEQLQRARQKGRAKMATKATIHEQGNGLASVGDYVAGDDGELYRVESIDSRIQTGQPGVANYVYATVELADWSDCEEDEQSTCVATIGAE